MPFCSVNPASQWRTSDSVPQWPSDISGNNWCGPVNSSPAADRMSDKNFGANPVVLGVPETQVGGSSVSISH